jgi:hypothetical protein
MTALPLLRARRERPRHSRATEYAEKFAPPLIQPQARTPQRLALRKRCGVAFRRALPALGPWRTFGAPRERAYAITTGVRPRPVRCGRLAAKSKSLVNGSKTGAHVLGNEQAALQAGII